MLGYVLDCHILVEVEGSNILVAWGLLAATVGWAVGLYRLDPLQLCHRAEQKENPKTE